jgi:diacylglycerol O-acyltransferase / wax synthase
MRQLSGLDAGFLYIESEQTPMHVGSLTIFQRPDGLSSAEFTDKVRAHIQSRLHLAPIFHQRLALMPFDLGHPVWVEAGELDFDYHFCVHRLGGAKRRKQTLEELVAHLHEGMLSREHPLWQFHLIEDLPDHQIGFYSKVHHAALDGAAGVLLANALLDLSETPRVVEKPLAGVKIKSPSRSKLLGSLFSNTLAQYAKLARTLPSAVKRVADVAMSKGVGGAWNATRELGQGLMAPKTPFNVSVSAQRRFAKASVSLAEIKAIAAASDSSINDVVMAICSGALRRFLQATKQLPSKSLIAAIPISLRELSDQRLNNQVTMVPASLGTDCKTAAKRLEAVKAAMTEVKTTTGKFKDLIPTDYPGLGAPWLIGGIAQLVAKTKLVERLSLPANLVISNVPGPKVPLYLAGAKMLAYYPMSIVVHGLALNITVHSYATQLDFGLIACAQAVSDLAPLADAILAEHAELKNLAAQILLSPAHPASKRSNATDKSRRAGDTTDKSRQTGGTTNMPRQTGGTTNMPRRTDGKANKLPTSKTVKKPGPSAAKRAVAKKVVAKIAPARNSKKTS